MLNCPSYIMSIKEIIDETEVGEVDNIPMSVKNKINADD